MSINLPHRRPIFAIHFHKCKYSISGSWASSDTIYYPWNELQTRDLFQIYYIFKGNEYIKYNVTNRQVGPMSVSENSII